MKKFLLFLFLIPLYATCQYQPRVNVQSFNVKTEPEAFPPLFWDTLDVSLWYNHYFYRFANDTVVHTELSVDQKMLYVEIFNKSTQLYHMKTIMLDKKCVPIQSIYYHNNDSIFVILKRQVNYKSNPNEDFVLLLNGKGQLLHSYRLGNVSDIWDSNNINQTLVVRGCCNQMVNNELILWFKAYFPHASQSGYLSNNPPLVAALNTQNGNIRRLNIRCPVSLAEKKYAISQNRMWIQKQDNNNLLVGFPCSPFLYQYVQRDDRLQMIDCHYSSSFSNIDSASMEEGKDYFFYVFNQPEWVEKYHLYVRRIIIKNHPGYQVHDDILELLDSNFNHFSYVVRNPKYKTPYFYKGELISRNQISKRSHTVILQKRKRMPLQKMLEGVMIKVPQIKQDSLLLQKYLAEIGIPKKSIVLIVNFKYPCGECLDYLFSMMDKNRAAYAENHVYYIIYDADKSGLLDEIMMQHNLKNAENIIEDNTLLGNVYLAGESMGNKQFFAIDYYLEDSEHIAVLPIKAADLKNIFKRIHTRLGMEKP